MTRRLDSRVLADNAIIARHLSSAAKQSVLESKLIAQRGGCLAISAEGSSADITESITALVAGLGLPLTKRTSVYDGTGYYAGSVAGATDMKKALIRLAGTDNGVPDGTNDEVYGVVSETGGVISVSFKKADGSSYSFDQATSVDIYVVVIADAYLLSPEALLSGAVSGVVDAGQALTLATHLNGSGVKHGAAEIGNEVSAGEISSGTETALRMFSPADVVAMIAAHESSAYVPPAEVSAEEIAAGTETAIRSFSPADVKAMVDAFSDNLPAEVSAEEIAAGTATALRSFSPADVKAMVEAFADVLPAEVSSEEIAAGTETGLRSFSPADVKEMVIDHAPAEKYQKITLSSGQITAKAAALSFIPEGPVKVIFQGLSQTGGAVDFDVVDGSLVWDKVSCSVGMEDELLAGDVLEVYFASHTAA